MPYRSKRLCERCKQAYAGTRCEQCYVPYSRVTVHPFSTRRGRKLRDKIRKAHPICQACGERLVDEVDHIIPVSVDSSLGMDPGNLQSLCTQCHKDKTYKDRHKYRHAG